MNRGLKIAGGIAGAAIVLVVVGAVVVASQFDAARIKSELAKTVLEKKQRTLKIDGALTLTFWPNVGVNVGKLSLSEHQSAQEFAALDGARVSVAVLPLLSKQVVVNTVELNGLRAQLVKHKDGTLNIDDLLSKDKSDSQPLQIDIAGVRVAGAQLSWRDEKAGGSAALSGLDLTTGRIQADTGKQTLQIDNLALAAAGKLDADAIDIKIDAPRLALAPEKSGGDTITLRAKLAGAQRQVAATLALNGVEGTAQAVKVAKLALTVDARAGDAGVKGMLDAAVDADLARQALALDKLTGSLELNHPRIPTKQIKLPLVGGAHVDLARHAAEGHIDTQFADGRIAFKFKVDKFAPLALGFNLDIDRLNLDKYLPAKNDEAKSPGGDGKIDLGALKGLDVNGMIRIGSLQAANIKASNIKLQLKAAGGKLDIAPHSANLYEGTASGALSLDANGNAITLKENLAGVSIGPLLKDVAAKDMLEGKGSIALDIATRGNTVPALKQALGGTARVTLTDGALKGINLAQSFRDLKSKFSSKQDAVQQAKLADKTDFSELSASFRIANGVAHNDDLSAKSPFLRLGGNGDIDIGHDRLDYLAKASVVATSGGQGTRDLDHLKGLTIPVRVSGPFDSPSYKIEFAGLATGAVKAKVEEKTQEIKQQAGDKLKGGLKGLFGK